MQNTVLRLVWAIGEVLAVIEDDVCKIRAPVGI